MAMIVGNNVWQIYCIFVSLVSIYRLLLLHASQREFCFHFHKASYQPSCSYIPFQLHDLVSWSFVCYDLKQLIEVAMDGVEEFFKFNWCGLMDIMRVLAAAAVATMAHNDTDRSINGVKFV